MIGLVALRGFTEIIGTIYTSCSGIVSFRPQKFGTYGKAGT